MTLEEDARELASIVAAKEILADAEKRVRNRIQIALRRGQVRPCITDESGNEVELALITITNPATVKVSVTDAHLAIPWAADMFGDSVADLRLTEQGMSSVTAYAKKEYTVAGKPAVFAELPGVRVSVETGQPRMMFRPNKDIDFISSVRDLWASCELPIPHLLDGHVHSKESPLPFEAAWDEDAWQKRGES